MFASILRDPGVVGCPAAGRPEKGRWVTLRWPFHAKELSEVESLLEVTSCRGRLLQSARGI